jgi:hypothetical protein
MAGCASQTFSGITQARFDCLVQKAQASDLAISGNVGVTSKDGITISWNFDPVSQTLELQCTDAPFLLPCETINGRINELVDGCP